MENDKLIIEVNANDANILLAGLLELPGKVGMNVYINVRSQCEKQLAAKQQPDAEATA